MTGRSPETPGAPPRLLGFCSAVVLFVLLVTAGLPAEGCGAIGREPVAVRCEGLRVRDERLLASAVAERTAAVVQHLHHADQLRTVVHQRQRDAAPGVETGAGVDLAVEARVGITVGHVDRDTVTGAGADQAGAHRQSHLAQIGGHFEHQLVPHLVEQPHRRPFGTQHAARGARDGGQHRTQVERGRQRPGDGQHRLQVQLQQRLATGLVCHDSGRGLVARPVSGPSSGGQS